MPGRLKQSESKPDKLVPLEEAFHTASHIRIEHLLVHLVIVPIPLAVMAVDLIDGLPHLGHILIAASMQHLLSYRLLGTSRPPKSGLSGWIGSQPGIDPHHAMGSRQHGNESVIKLVKGAVLHRFLGNTHQTLDRSKEVDLLRLDSQNR